MENTKWLEWAKELQAIAQAGLTYSTDVFDRERFEMIRDMSVEMMAYQTHEKQSVIRDLFANEVGYATPKVDVRAVIFKNDCTCNAISFEFCSRGNDICCGRRIDS